MNNRKYARRGAFAAALVLIAIGLVQQQYADVLTKAVQICLECVGIG